MSASETVSKTASTTKPPSNPFKVNSRDPWARREAWRKDPFFSRANTIRGLAPGFGIASVAFAIYCAAEYAMTPKDSHH